MLNLFQHPDEHLVMLNSFQHPGEHLVMLNSFQHPVLMDQWLGQQAERMLREAS
jgi:hypothetical protein